MEGGIEDGEIRREMQAGGGGAVEKRESEIKKRKGMEGRRDRGMEGLREGEWRDI